MADKSAVQDGNWSDPATWGGTLPGPTDTVLNNSYVVAIDQDIDVAGLRGTAGVWQGFQIFTLPADGERVLDVKSMTAESTAVLTINADGKVRVIGDVISASGGSGDYPIVVSTTVGYLDLVIEGDVTQTEGKLSAVRWSGTNTGGSITITGNVTQSGLTNSSSTVDVSNATSVSIDVWGTASNSNTTGAGFAVYAPLTTLPVRVGKMVDGPTGKVAVFAPFIVARPEMSHNTERTVCTSTGGSETLKRFHPYSPPPADVRDGTVYGPDGLLTGTAKIPPAAAVASGTAVDAGTGTATDLTGLAGVIGAQLAAAIGA